MSKFVLVETISQYRMRYVIEVPDNHNDGMYECSATQWAEDTVTCEEMREFSQKWVGESILSSREVSREEVLELCDIDNDYCSSWTDDHKIHTFVTEVGYSPKTHTTNTEEDEWTRVRREDAIAEGAELHSKYYYDTDRNR